MIERVIEMSHVRDCIFDVISKCDLIGENIILRRSGVTDDISLMIINGTVENIIQEKNSLRGVFFTIIMSRKPL